MLRVVQTEAQIHTNILWKMSLICTDDIQLVFLYTILLPCAKETWDFCILLGVTGCSLPPHWIMVCTCSWSAARQCFVSPKWWNCNEMKERGNTALPVWEAGNCWTVVFVFYIFFFYRAPIFSLSLFERTKSWSPELQLLFSVILREICFAARA